MPIENSKTKDLNSKEASKDKRKQNLTKDTKEIKRSKNKKGKKTNNESCLNRA